MAIWLTNENRDCPMRTGDCNHWHIVSRGLISVWCSYALSDAN